ncbi:hypothetical protein B0T26DRAFT_719675 [Lasiosphaeria miniovina]|uniref:Protein kinase domain-containing protein n=1 Tax=Lasiosphaeria miniovina TaxID=1954250 RepID=A0AA40AEE5_9PEZI|nr:uncharacterized protein B0T26DRAFT_719675 [Lasiosphaeria miniovina]KAK0714148.1 hypothetical protein B0T26DRAFT_719675 [Lasiosphaeria miniovina]
MTVNLLRQALLNNGHPRLTAAMSSSFRPPMPYFVNQTLKLHRVEPPRPLYGVYLDALRQHPERESDTQLKKYLDFVEEHRHSRRTPLDLKTLVNFCLSTPALPCVRRKETATVKIVKVLAGIGGTRNGGPLVVLCEGLQSVVGGKTITALKICDPLCFPFAERFGPSRARNIVADAENAATVESAAFLQLDHHIGGSFIPKFHGLWIFDMPFPASHQSSPPMTRKVFAMAMDYVEGTVLSDLDPANYTGPERLRVVAKAIEAYTMIRHHQVRHNDMSPRNIVCSTKDLASERLKVDVIDFDAAEVLPLLVGYVPPKPSLPSPRQLFWESIPWEMQGQGWIPENWDEDKWNDWLNDNFAAV